MDFNDMNRKQLQALCKKHKIPANGTNEDMKSALTSLLKEEQNPITNSSGETEIVGENGVRKGKKVTFCLESEQMDLGENPDPKMEKDFRRRSILKPQQEELNPIAIRTTRSRGKSLPEQIPVIDLTSPPVQKKKPLKAIVETVSEEVQVDDLVAVTEIPVVRSLRSREVSTDEIVVPSKKKEVIPRKTRRGVIEEPQAVHEVEDVPVVKPKSSAKRATEKGDEGTVVLEPANAPRRTRRNASASGIEEATSQEPKVINEVKEIPDSKPKRSAKRAIEQDDQETVALEPANALRRTRRNASTSEKEEANSQEQKVINEVRDVPDSKPKRSGKRTTEQEDDGTVALEPANAPRRTGRNASTFGKDEANSEEPMVIINEVGDVPDSKPKRSGKTSTGQEDKVNVALVTEIAPRRSRRNASTSEKEESYSEEPMVTNEVGEVPDLKPKRSGKKSTGQEDKVTVALETESAPRRSKRNDSAYEKEQADSAKEIKNEPKRQVVPRQSQRNAAEPETTAPKPETRSFIETKVQKERVLLREEPRRWTRKSRAVVTEDETAAMEDDSKTVSKLQDPPKVIATRASKRKSIAPTELVVDTGLGTNKRRKLAEKSLSKEVVSVPEASKLEENPSRRSTRRASLDNILPLADKKRTTDGPKERNEALDGKSLLIDKTITLTNVAESYEEKRKHTKSQKRRRVTIKENEALQTQNAALLVQEPSRRSRRSDSRNDLVTVTTTSTGSAEMVQKEKLEENVDAPQIEILVLDKKIRAGGDSVEPKPLEKKHSSKGRRGKTVKKHGEKKLEDRVAVEEVTTHEEAILGDQELSLVKDGETSQFPDHREAEQLEPLGKEDCSVVPPVVSHADILPSTLKSDHTYLSANKEVSPSEETDSVVDYVNVKEVMVHGRQNEETILEAQEVPLVSDGGARLLDCCDRGEELEHLNKEASTVVSTVLISPVDNVLSILQSDHAESFANRGFSTIENISASPMIVEEINDQNCSDGKGAMVELSDADSSVKTLWVHEETDVVTNTQTMTEGTEFQESKEYTSNGGAVQSKPDEKFETTPSEAFADETSNLDLSEIDQADSTHPSSTGLCRAEEQLEHLGTEASVMVSTGVISQADDLSFILQSAHTDNVANKKIPTSENTSSSPVAVEEVKDQNCFVEKGGVVEFFDADCSLKTLCVHEEIDDVNNTQTLADGTEYLESKEYTADGMTDAGVDQFKFANIIENVPPSPPFAVETSNLDPNEIVQADCSHPASIEFPNCFSPRAVEDASGHSTLKRTMQLTHGYHKIGHLQELEFKDSEASEVKLWEDTEESIIDVRKEDDEQESKEELDVEFSGEVNEKQCNVNPEHGHLGENVDVLTNRPLEFDYKVSCDALAYLVSNKEEAIGGAQELPLVSGVGSSSLLNHNELDEDAIHGAQELPLVIGVPKHCEEGEQSKPQEEESSADASEEISSGDSNPKDGGAAFEKVMVPEIVEKETILGTNVLQSMSDGGTTHVVVDLSKAEEQSKPVEKEFSDMAYNEVIGDDDSILQSGCSDYAASEKFLVTENTIPKDCSVDVKDLDRSDGKKGQVELSDADGSMEPLCLHEEIVDITNTPTFTEETKYQESHQLVDERMTNAAGSQLKIEHYFQVSPTSESVAVGTYGIEPNEIDQIDSLPAIDNSHVPSTGFYHCVSTKVLEDKSVETDSTSKEPTVQYIRGNDECIHLEETVEVSTRQISELGFEVVSETSEVKWEESPGENIAAIRKELCEQECKKECDVGLSVEVRETEWNVNNEYVHLGENVEIPTQQSSEIDFGSVLQTTFSTPLSKGSAGVSPKALEDKPVERDSTSKEPIVQYICANDECIHLEETAEVSTRQTLEFDCKVISETSEVKWEESPGENISAIRKEICEQDCKKERDVGVSDEVRETEWNVNNEYVPLVENVEVPTQQSSEIDFGSILQTTFSTPVSKGNFGSILQTTFCTPVSKGVSPKVPEDKSVETDSTSKERTIQSIHGNDECVHLEETVELSTRQISELDFKVVTETSKLKWEESPGENVAAIRKEICEQECKKERDVGDSVEARETEWNVNNEYVHLEENVEVLTQQSSEIDFGSILQTTFSTPVSKGSAGVSPKVLEDKSVETDSTSKERTVQCIHGYDECIHLEETVELLTQKTLKLDFEVVSETSEPKWEESPGENISAIRKEICEQECENECDVGASVEVQEMEPNVNNEYVHLGENVEVPTQQPSELDFGSIFQTTFSTPVSKAAVCTSNEDDENNVAGIRRTFDTPVSRVCSSMKVVGEEYVADMYSEMERQKDTKEAFVKVEGDCEQNTEDKLKMGVPAEIIQKKMNAHTSLEEIVGKSNEQSVAGVFQRSLDDLCESGSNLQRPFDTSLSEGSINRVKDEDKNAVIAKPNRDTEKSNEDLRDFGTTLRRTLGTPSPVSEGSEEEHKQNRKEEVNMDVSVEALAQKLNHDASPEDIDRQHSAQTTDMVSHRLSDAGVSMDEIGFNLRGPFDTPASEVSLNKVQRKDNVAAIAEMDADAKRLNDDLSDIGTSLRITIVTPVSKVCSSTKVDPDDDMAAIEEMDSNTKMFTEYVSDLGTTLRRNFGTPVSTGSLNKVQDENKNAVTSETNTNTESLVEDLCDFRTTLRRTFDTPVSEGREHEQKHKQNIEEEIKMNVSVEAIAKKLSADASLEEIGMQPSAQAATILTHRLSDADASMDEIGSSLRGSFGTPASPERNSVTESLKDDLCDFGKSSRKTVSTPLSKEMDGHTEKLNEDGSDFCMSLQKTFDTSVSKVPSSIKVQAEENVATIGGELSRQAPAMVPQSLSDDLCYFALSPQRSVGIPLSIGAVCGSNKVVVEDNMASTSDLHPDTQIEDLPNTCLSLGKTFGSPSSEVSSWEPSEVYVAGIADEDVGSKKPNKNVGDFCTTFQNFSDTPVSKEGAEYTARKAEMNRDISYGQNIEGDNLILNEAVMEEISSCDGSKFIKNADNNETPHFSETNSQSEVDSEECIEAEEENSENVAEFDEAEDDIDFVQHVPDELFKDFYFERDYDFVHEAHNAKQESQEGIDRRSMSQVALEELAEIETSLPVANIVEHNFNQEENALSFSFNDKDAMEISEFSHRFADPVVDGGDNHKLNDANEHENVSLLSSVAETDRDQEVGSPATSVTPLFTTEGGIDESKFDEASETEQASSLPVVDHSDNDRDTEAQSPISLLNSVEEAEIHAEMRGTGVMASAGGTDEIGSLLRKMHISSAAKMSRTRTSMTANTPKKSFDSVMKENMLSVKMEHSATPYPVDRSVKRRALEDLRKSGKRDDKKLRFLNP